VTMSTSRRSTTRGRRISTKPTSKSIYDAASQHTKSVVLELGSALIRVGIAGESKPRHVIPHNLFDIKRSSDGYYLTTAPQEWEKILLSFFADLYTKYLLLKPRSRRVILLVGNAYQYPTSFRTALESVMLYDLSVPSILFVDQFRTIIPYALGHTQKMGILLDVGRIEARVGCVFEETCLIDSFNIVPCGFEALARIVMDYCRERMQIEVEHIHDGLAIVESCIQNHSSSDEIVCHLPHANRHITVNRKVLDDCIHEMYLNPANPNSLVHAFFNSLLACPIDLRKDMVRNVVLVGGATRGVPLLEQKFMESIRGFFQEQVVQIDKDEERRYDILSIQHAKFKSLATVVMDTPLSITFLPFSPTVIAWVGGSIMGSLNLSKEKWIHRAD